jgi:hypothetical protein
VWRQEEVEIMIHIESSLLVGHQHLAKLIMVHLPDKTFKQIKEKRKEQLYMARLEQYKASRNQLTEPEQLEIIASSSESEPDFCPTTTRLHIAETEDEGTTHQDEIPGNHDNQHSVRKRQPQSGRLKRN